MQTCPIHNQPWKTVPAGISKTTGKHFNAFQVCPQFGCKEKPPRETGPAGDFNRSLDNAASNIDEKKKGEAMGRNNIAHAMIRAGFVPSFENLTLAETWFQWSRGSMPLIVGKTPRPDEVNPAYFADENPLG